MKRYLLLAPLIGLVLLPRDVTWAQTSDLQEGFSMAEVSSLLGPPLERTERETKREEEWRYAKKTVTFREGKVQDWNPRVQEPTEPTDPEAHATANGATDADSELAGILGVILKEGGEKSDEPQTGLPPMPGVTVIETPK